MPFQSSVSLFEMGLLHSDQMGQFGFGAASSFSPSLYPGAALDLDFQNGLYYRAGVGNSIALVSCSRASSGTNLLPTSISGYAYNTFLSNVARVTSGAGLLVEEARTNQLLNSTVPVTQTTASLGTGTYTLWVNGAGSATSSAGTATATGYGAATNGTPNTIVVTGAGTVVITVAGALNAFQLELGTFGTSLIVTAGVTASRAADIVTVTSLPIFGSVYTLFAKVTPNAPATYATNQVLLTVDDNTASNRSQLQRVNFTGQTSVQIIAGGSTLLNTFAVPVLGTGISLKVAGAFAPSDQAIVANGSISITNSSGTPPAGGTITQIHIGTRPTSPQWNGYIERAVIWPTTRLSNVDLQRITA